jgi:hypothetical protein
VTRLAVVILAVLALGGGVAYAAFSARSENPTTIRAADDFFAPNASAVALGKTAGTTGDGIGTAGFLRQGGTFRVYANVTDTGNPASGTAPGTVRADLSTFWPASTSVALDPLPTAVTVDGQSYTHRSAALVLPNPTAASASRAVSLTLTDVAGNTRSRPGIATVAIDNTAPIATDVATANRTGGITRQPEAGDTITFTYAEPIDPTSLSAGWDGRSALNARVAFINNDPAAGGNDSFTVLEQTGTARVRVGSVSLGRTDYVTANRGDGGRVVEGDRQRLDRLRPPRGGVRRGAQPRGHERHDDAVAAGPHRR